MNTDREEVTRLLRQHLSDRHPRQGRHTRWLLRRMTLYSLARVHRDEHTRHGAQLGHTEDDFSDVVGPDTTR